MSQPLRIGIVGCGGIARSHVRAYQACPEAKLVALYDVAAASAAKLKADLPDVRLAASPEDMAAQDNLDAVSICTPPSAHLDNCRPFLASGIPVLCEKPLEVNLARARKLAALAQRSGTPFMTAFCHRYHPAVRELKRLIDAGTLGTAVHFRNLFGGYLDLKGNHRTDPALSGGGCLIDHCCHSVDLFRFLVGEPTHVQALAGNVAQAVPIEDFGMIQLSVGGKAFGEITASYSLRVCDNTIEWYGSKGTAVISYWVEGQPDLRYRLATDQAWQTVDVSAHPDRFTGEVRAFLACVKSGQTPPITATDGVQASRLADAIYRSATSGRKVALARRTAR